eukprot:g51827.t1
MHWTHHKKTCEKVKSLKEKLPVKKIGGDWMRVVEVDEDAALQVYRTYNGDEEQTCAVTQAAQWVASRGVDHP